MTADPMNDDPPTLAASAPVKLTKARLAILRMLAREPGDGMMTAVWISEGCGYPYDPAWARTRLVGLVKHGLVDKSSPGLFTITDLGRAALRKGGET